MIFLRPPLLLALGTLLLSACTTHTEPQTTRVSLMTWNVENLFDTEHDAGKDDFAYLPLSVKRAHPEYLASCTKIEVPAWRKECEENDWT
ncbi:MAG: hypothetical protein J6D44_16620, partial [Pseudomonas sp.]|nr:hypothetical protein [Pseudomonas sp.]